MTWLRLSQKAVPVSTVVQKEIFTLSFFPLQKSPGLPTLSATCGMETSCADTGSSRDLHPSLWATNQCLKLAQSPGLPPARLWGQEGAIYMRGLGC